jgi:hypothetical protein
MITLRSSASGVNDGVRHVPRGARRTEAPRQHERQRHADAADDGEEACTAVHQRVSKTRAFACWQLLQLHVSPQLQTSPHWHEAVGTGAGVWQPQVH